MKASFVGLDPGKGYGRHALLWYLMRKSAKCQAFQVGSGPDSLYGGMKWKKSLKHGILDEYEYHHDHLFRHALSNA